MYLETKDATSCRLVTFASASLASTWQEGDLASALGHYLAVHLIRKGPFDCASEKGSVRDAGRWFHARRIDSSPEKVTQKANGYQGN